MLLRLVSALLGKVGLAAIPSAAVIGFAATMIVGSVGLYGAKRWADFKANLRNEGAAQCQLATTAAEVEALRASQADLVARLNASQEREAAVLQERDEARSVSSEAQARIAELSRGLQATIPDAIVDIINRPVRSDRALKSERAP